MSGLSILSRQRGEEKLKRSSFQNNTLFYSDIYSSTEFLTRFSSLQIAALGWGTWGDFSIYLITNRTGSSVSWVYKNLRI